MRTGSGGDGFPHSLSEIITRNVRENPDAVAVSSGDDTVSYAELDDRVARLAARLARQGAAGRVAGVCLPRGIELVVAVLAVLAAGGAYLPLDFGWPPARRRALADSAQAAFVLTSAAETSVFDGIPVLAVTDTRGAATGSGTMSRSGPDDLAYVIFTSGSTGEPKPVAVTHGAVLRHADALRTQMRLTATDRVLQFASIGFDAAAEELYPTWWAGGQVVLLPTAAPTAAELERVLATAGVTVLNLPTSYWHQWAADLARTGRRLPESLRLVVIGGEAASSAVARGWLRHPGVPLLNTYGVTEATITSTVLPVTADHLGSETVPIGRPIPGTGVHVLDARLDPVPPGEPGELHLSGAGLARGYLHNAELTAQRFLVDPHGAGRLYRTGDLVRQDGDGLLHHLGRVDQQVKIRGHRIEPAEVTAVLIGHPELAEGYVAAVANAHTGETELVAYVVPADWHRVPTSDRLRAYLAERLPAALVPGSYVVISALPLGPTGKVDQRALPTISVRRGRGGDHRAPGTEIERGLAEIWQRVLGVDQVGLADNLFELGAHSLTAIRAAGEIQQRFGVGVDVRTLFSAATVGTLAVVVAEAARAAAAGGGTPSPTLPPITAAPDTASDPESDSAPVPLTYQQEQVWFIGRTAPDSIAYQTQTTIRVVGDLDLAALDRAVTELARRHEILRTTFPEVAGRPRQVAQPAAPVAVTRFDVRAEADPGAAAEQIVEREIRTPFDVRRLPVVRWTVIRLADDEHELVLVEHHLVHDGWSFALLMRELRALYTGYATGAGSPLPEPVLQYRDFARWQRATMADPVMRAQAAYWRARFPAPPPELVLPADHPRPKRPTFRGRTLRIELPPALPDGLRAFCREHQVTLFAALFAGFTALLRHYAGETDVCVGSAFANRRRPETADLVGMLVNTVLLRLDLGDDPAFGMLARRAHEVVLEAAANQEFPFRELVRELNPKRAVDRNPMTQILFSANDSPLTELDLGAAAGTIFEPGNDSAKVDLSVIVIPRAESQRGDAPRVDDRITLLWEYSTDLFDEPTMRRMADAYLRLLTAAVADPRTRVSALPLLAEADRRQLLAEWARGPAPAAPLVPVHRAVAAQAARTPHAPAVSAGGRVVDYAGLVGQARAVAGALVGLGVGADSVVGVRLPMGVELVVAELGVLFADAAYLPLDPADPTARQSALLADAGAPVLITDSPMAGDPAAGLDSALTVVGLDDLAATGAELPADRPRYAPGGLAYVIGTSGSTGKPKAVLVEHGSLANFCAYRRRALDLGPADRISAAHSPAFDSATGEVWSALTAGACLCVPDDEDRLSPRRLRSWLVEAGITVSHLPTGLGARLLELPWPDSGALRMLIVGGEKLYRRPPPDLPFAVLNEYGPTETTITVTAGLVTPGPDGRAPSIGRPIDGVTAYVLDSAARPVPVGVVGELHIGGAAVARGYAGRPELTEQRFVPDPFAVRPGARLYRTGDLARYRPTGELECLGRVDSQVKIRGYRVEPAEVTAALLAHPGLADAHVTSAADPHTPTRRLVAYLVPADPANPPTFPRLREHLARRLPEHMIPSVYRSVPALRRLASGKVDPAGLPDLAPTAEHRPATRRMPVNDLERDIARVWARVLKRDEVGVDENFFDLGGHSLLLGELADQLDEELGRRIEVVTFFEHPTVSALAAALADAARDTAAQPDDPAERAVLRDEQRQAGWGRLDARRAARGARS